jgi:hypothetical protein
MLCSEPEERDLTRLFEPAGTATAKGALLMMLSVLAATALLADLDLVIHLTRLLFLTGYQ